MPQIKICPGCLSTMPEDKTVCPFCGEDMNHTNPKGTLAYGSMLAGRYSIGHVLADDGEGILYQAVDCQGPSLVLIKEYLPVTLTEERTGDDAPCYKPGCEVLYKTTRMDFVDLYKQLMRVTPTTGLQTVLNVLEANNTAYAVLENTPGIPLEDYLNNSGAHLNPAEARSMLQPVFEGVSAMHQAGLVHRGISPVNIRVQESGKAVLCGYATLGLRTLGSPLHACLYEGYSAPEQYDKAQFEGRYTDAYALAAVFYRMVTGQTPMPAEQRTVSDHNPRARSLDSAIPSWLSRVLEQGMEMEPKDRIQTVNTLMSSLTSPTAADALRKDSKQIDWHKRQIMGMLSMILIGICVLIIILIWAMMPGGPMSQPEPTPSPEAPSATPAEKEYMPDFTGMTYQQIQTGGQYAGRLRFYLKEEYDDTAPAGTVLRQEPKANTELTPEMARAVMLFISKGPKDVLLRNVVGFTQDSAVTELLNQGLVPRCLIQANDGSYAVGCVIKTDPAAGEEVAPGSEVIVYIAAEPHRNVNNEDQLSMVEPTAAPTPAPTAAPTPAPTAAPTAVPPAPEVTPVPAA